LGRDGFNNHQGGDPSEKRTKSRKKRQPMKGRERGGKTSLEGKIYEENSQKREASWYKGGLSKYMEKR